MAASEPSLVRGTAVGGYVVGERIGAGGFGEVYAAEHHVLGRNVAIKILNEKYSADEVAVRRFIAEAKAVNTIAHPGIVEVFDFGRLEDGREYYVMELLVGTTLAALLDNRERLSLEEALPLLRDIASAISAAHAVGIAHRDLKPENVFVTSSGKTKLIDFGLAKLTSEQHDPVTQTGSLIGTPLYMSPEQCRGSKVDARTDVYSFGVLAYHVLVGEPPFSGDSLALALHHLNDAPESPSKRCSTLPPHVDAVLLALLAKDPDARPSLATALDALAGVTPLPRRTRARWWIGAVLAAGGATAAVLALRHPAATTFTHRTVPVNIAGVIQYPPSLDARGAKLLYTDVGGTWSLDLASGLTARADGNVTSSVMSDGRIVQTNIASAHIEIYDPATSVRTDLGTAGWFPSSSHDGKNVISLLDGWYQITDVATRTTRRLHYTDPSTYGAGTWSRDDRHFLWTKADKESQKVLYLTDVATGTTRNIPAPILLGTNPTAAASFLDDGRIIYCAEDDAGVSIRTRDPEDVTGATEAIVVPLDPTATACAIASSTGRVVVTIVFGRPAIGTINLAAERPEVTPVGGSRNFRLAAMSSDATRVFAFEQNYAPWRSATQERTLQEIVVSTGAIRALRMCALDESVVWIDDALFHITVTSTSARLFDGSCNVVDEWTLPEGAWTVRACTRDVCYGTRNLQGTNNTNQLEVSKLHRGRQTVERLAIYPAENDAEGASISISADAGSLAVREGWNDRLHIIGASGEVSVFDFDGVQIDPFGAGYTALGADPIIAGRRDARAFAIVQRGPDRRPKWLWSSDSTYMDPFITSPLTTIAACGYRAMRTEIMVLDPR